MSALLRLIAVLISCALACGGPANVGITRGHSDSPSPAGTLGEARHDAGTKTRTRPALSSPDADSNDAGETRALPPSAAVPLKIALLGDQGVRADARAVLNLIVGEGAVALIHLGDFAYSDGTPSAWDAQLSDVLGANFPVFAAIGNHDTADWKGKSGFQAFLQARLSRVPEARCQGDYGVNSSCTFRGLFFVLSGVGTYGSGHEAFLESALAGSDEAPFRLCIWHKTQHDMQVGAKTDEVGWDAYRICAKHGVPIVTGHEHSYARTFALTAIGDSAQHYGVVDEPELIALQRGRTVVTVAGLGGQSRRQRTQDHASDSWWASIYARDYQLENGRLMDTAPSILYGALFLEIGAEGDPKLARAYFKTTDGKVRDEFMIRMAAQP